MMNGSLPAARRGPMGVQCGLRQRAWSVQKSGTSWPSTWPRPTTPLLALAPRASLSVGRADTRILVTRLGRPRGTPVERAQSGCGGTGPSGRATTYRTLHRPRRRCRRPHLDAIGLGRACPAVTVHCMKPDGRRLLYVPNGLVDGPLPTQYEPAESPVPKPALPPAVRAGAQVLEARRQRARGRSAIKRSAHHDDVPAHGALSVGRD